MTGVLIDTSVWVDHFRQPNRQLVECLECDGGFTHPLIIGEIACGTPPNRATTLQALEQLNQVQQVSWSELHYFIEQHALFGKGCGVVDLILLASTVLTRNVRLWTLDKRLAALARELGVSYVPFEKSRTER